MNMFCTEDTGTPDFAVRPEHLLERPHESDLCQVEVLQVETFYNMDTITTGVDLSVLGMVVQYSAFGYCLYLLWHHLICCVSVKW